MEAKSCAWCAHFKACMQNVRHDPKFIPLAYRYSQLKSKGENNDVVRITHKTAYLGLMQHWQSGNQENAHEFMVAILNRINSHL